jgi:hypothetical protein
MLTKSEKMVWAAAFAQCIAKSDAKDAIQFAYRTVMNLRRIDIPEFEKDYDYAKMLTSMREMPYTPTKLSKSKP